jgi:sugar phosphate isomerase/epimerase
MSLKPLTIGVCSWSLQVVSVPELASFLTKLGVEATQIACGDPNHASWNEGDDMPSVAKKVQLPMTGAMLGFPGEDYTTPQTIKESGGFGNPTTRGERLKTFQWGLQRTLDLGLTDLMLHAGFIPEPGDADRKAFLDTLGQVSALAAAKGVTIAFETGQETADLLRLTLNELKCANLKVNFDPANMLLYDMGDPLRAVEVLAGDIRSVHVKDANRPTTPGTWGQEVPLGQGQVNIKEFVKRLKKVGYTGPLCVEREVGNQQERFNDIKHGIEYLQECLGGS